MKKKAVKKVFPRGVPTRRKVALVLDLVGAAGRAMLSGVSRFLSEGHLWRLEILLSSNAPIAESLRRLDREGLDGYIVTELGPSDGVEILAQSPLPAVFINVDEECLAGRRGSSV